MDYRAKFEKWCASHGIDTVRVQSSGAYMTYRASWCWKCLAAVLGIDEYKYEDEFPEVDESINILTAKSGTSSLAAKQGE